MRNYFEILRQNFSVDFLPGKPLTRKNSGDLDNTIPSTAAGLSGTVVVIVTTAIFPAKQNIIIIVILLILIIIIYYCEINNNINDRQANEFFEVCDE